MKELKINNAEYRIDPLSAKEAYKLLATIIALTGSAAEYLPSILKQVDKDKALADIIAFAASSEMIEKNGVDAFVDLKGMVLGYAKIKTESGRYEDVSIDRDFTGKLDDAEKLFDAVIKEHLSPFLQGGLETSPVAFAALLIRNLFRTQK